MVGPEIWLSVFLAPFWHYESGHDNGLHLTAGVTKFAVAIWAIGPLEALDAPAWAPGCKNILAH